MDLWICDKNDCVHLHCVSFSSLIEFETFELAFEPSFKPAFETAFETAFEAFKLYPLHFESFVLVALLVILFVLLPAVIIPVVVRRVSRVLIDDLVGVHWDRCRSHGLLVHHLSLNSYWLGYWRCRKLHLERLSRVDTLGNSHVVQSTLRRPDLHRHPRAETLWDCDVHQLHGLRLWRGLHVVAHGAETR